MPRNNVADSDIHYKQKQLKYYVDDNIWINVDTFSCEQTKMNVNKQQVFKMIIHANNIK